MTKQKRLVALMEELAESWEQTIIEARRDGDTHRLRWAEFERAECLSDARRAREDIAGFVRANSHNLP